MAFLVRGILMKRLFLALALVTVFSVIIYAEDDGNIIETSTDLDLQVSSLIEAKLGLSQSFVFPFLQGKGPLTQGNNIAMLLRGEISPVSVGGGSASSSESAKSMGGGGGSAASGVNTSAWGGAASGTRGGVASSAGAGGGAGAGAASATAAASPAPAMGAGSSPAPQLVITSIAKITTSMDANVFFL
jgi:hypothetical protein